MKRFLLGLVVLTALLVGGAVGATAAQAHADLVSSSPEDGAVLDGPPQELTFTFSEDLLPDFVQFIATAPDGETGDLQVSGVSGPTATIAWPLGAPGGEWRIDYRVVSQDGHPIDGGITFSYAASSPSPEPTSASPTAEPTPGPTSPSASPEPTTPAPAPSPEVSPAAASGGGATGWILAGAAVLLIGIVAAVIVAARRRS